jgi:hypothetical protein
MGLTDLVGFKEFNLVTRFSNLRLVHKNDGEILEAHSETCFGCSATKGLCGRSTKALKGDKLTFCDGELVIQFNLGGV